MLRCLPTKAWLGPIQPHSAYPTSRPDQSPNSYTILYYCIPPPLASSKPVVSAQLRRLIPVRQHNRQLSRLCLQTPPTRAGGPRPRGGRQPRVCAAAEALRHAASLSAETRQYPLREPLITRSFSPSTVNDVCEVLSILASSHTDKRHRIDTCRWEHPPYDRSCCPDPVTSGQDLCDHRRSPHHTCPVAIMIKIWADYFQTNNFYHAHAQRNRVCKRETMKKLPTVLTQRPLGFVLLIDAARIGATRKAPGVTNTIGDATSTSDAMCPTACHHQTFKTTVFTARDTPAEAPIVPMSPRRTTFARSTSDVCAKGATNLDIGPTLDSMIWMRHHCVKLTSNRKLDVRTRIACDQRKMDRAGTVPSMSVSPEGAQRREIPLKVLIAASVRHPTNQVSGARVDQVDRSL